MFLVTVSMKDNKKMLLNAENNLYYFGNTLTHSNMENIK